MIASRHLRAHGSIYLLCAIALLFILPDLAVVEADADLWWHLKVGLDIVTSLAIPTTDSYSYISSSVEWVNHEWLFDAILGVAYERYGVLGLSFIHGVLLLVTTLGLVLLISSRWKHHLVTAAVFVFLLPFFQIIVNVRAHSFTYCFIVITLLCLDQCRKGRMWVLWLFPLIMLLWVNIHGGFLFGLAIIVVTLLSFIVGIDTHEIQPTSRSKNAMLAALLFTAAIPLANPYGFELFWYIVRQADSSYANTYITEWQSVHGKQWGFFLGLTVPTTLALFLSRQITRPAEIVFFFGFAVLTYRHARFFPLLAIFSSLVFFHAAEVLWNRHLRHIGPKLSRYTNSPLLLVIFAIALTPISLNEAMNRFRAAGASVTVDHEFYPYQAIQFLQQHHFDKELALPLEWGGYAIWHLYPHYTVALDGRNVTRYDQTYVGDYMKAYQQGDLVALLARAAPKVILTRTESKLHQNLLNSKMWNRVFEDPISAVFVAAPNELQVTTKASLPDRVQFP